VTSAVGYFVPKQRAKWTTHIVVSHGEDAVQQQPKRDGKFICRQFGKQGIFIWQRFLFCGNYH
jgi:hypothetical protein